jgi:hypothetical protein
VSQLGNDCLSKRSHFRKRHVEMACGDHQCMAKTLICVETRRTQSAQRSAREAFKSLAFRGDHSSAIPPCVVPRLSIAVDSRVLGALGSSCRRGLGPRFRPGVPPSRTRLVFAHHRMRMFHANH